MGYLIYRLVIMLLLAGVGGLLFWFVYSLLSKSKRVGKVAKVLDQRQTNPECIDSVDELKDEVQDRVAVSEAARASMRNDEEELKELFPENRKND